MPELCQATTVVRVPLHDDVRVQCQLDAGHRGNHWSGDQESGQGTWRVSATWRQEDAAIDYGARGGQPFGYA